MDRRGAAEIGRKHQRAVEPWIVCSRSRKRLVANPRRACEQPRNWLTDRPDVLPQSWKRRTYGTATRRATACRLYEGGAVVKPCVSLLTPFTGNLPGRACPVKRQSRFTLCERQRLLALDRTP